LILKRHFPSCQASKLSGVDRFSERRNPSRKTVQNRPDADNPPTRTIRLPFIDVGVIKP
jgi:hypothetical protein